MQVTIRITGNAETKARLRKIGSGINDMKDAMEHIGQKVGHYYKNDVFMSSGGALGKKWAPLKASTIRNKKRAGFRQNITVPLVGSGTMRDSFIAKSTKTNVIITNSTDYFKYHQSSAPRRRLPRRQMIGINNPIKTIIRDIIKDDIARKIRNA